MIYLTSGLRWRRTWVCLLTVALCACSSRSRRIVEDSAQADIGPRIALDGARLTEERHNTALLDSAGDTSRDIPSRADRRAIEILDAQQLLGRLGYGVRFTGVLDSSTMAAIHAFENRHG